MCAVVCGMCVCVCVCVCVTHVYGERNRERWLTRDEGICSGGDQPALIAGRTGSIDLNNKAYESTHGLQREVADLKTRDNMLWHKARNAVFFPADNT